MPLSNDLDAARRCRDHLQDALDSWPDDGYFNIDFSAVSTVHARLTAWIKGSADDDEPDAVCRDGDPNEYGDS